MFSRISRSISRVSGQLRDAATSTLAPSELASKEVMNTARLQSGKQTQPSMKATKTFFAYLAGVSIIVASSLYRWAVEGEEASLRRYSRHAQDTWHSLFTQAMALRCLLNGNRMSEFVEHELTIEPTRSASDSTAVDQTNFLLGCLWRNAFAFSVLLQQKNGLNNSLKRMDMTGNAQQLIDRLTVDHLLVIANNESALALIQERSRQSYYGESNPAQRTSTTALLQMLAGLMSVPKTRSVLEKSAIGRELLEEFGEEAYVQAFREHFERTETVLGGTEPSPGIGLTRFSTAFTEIAAVDTMSAALISGYSFWRSKNLQGFIGRSQRLRAVALATALGTSSVHLLSSLPLLNSSILSQRQFNAQMTQLWSDQEQRKKYQESSFLARLAMGPTLGTPEAIIFSDMMLRTVSIACGLCAVSMVRFCLLPILVSVPLSQQVRLFVATRKEKRVEKQLHQQSHLSYAL